MKIRRIRVLLFERQLDGTAWNPAFRWTERRVPLVVIEDEDGVCGTGEAWSGYTGYEGVLNTLLRDVVPVLTGQECSSCDDIAALTRRLMPGVMTRNQSSAWSAVDTALWDLFARRQGVPVWKLLGGSSASVPVYASGGLYRDGRTPDDLFEEAAGYRRRGFRAMKMKIAGVSPEEDAERMAAVRRGMGEKAILWVDAVGQLTVEDVTDRQNILSEYGIRAIQSPVPPDNIEGLQQIIQSGIFVVASEAEYRNAEFYRLLAGNAVSCLQFCIPLCGGFTGARYLAELAASYGKKNTPQCFSTAVAQAASLHFAASCQSTLITEYHCFHDHLHELFENDAGQVHDGLACAGNSPGLGIRIPEAGRYGDGSVISLVAESH